MSYTNPNGPNPDYTYILPLSGSSDTTYTTAVQLAQFTKTINGYFLFDEPGGFLNYNGVFQSCDFDSVTAIGSGSGSITYSYTPLRSALPEPASWATMMAGMGLVGVALRRRRGVTARVAFGWTRAAVTRRGALPEEAHGRRAGSAATTPIRSNHAWTPHRRHVSPIPASGGQTVRFGWRAAAAATMMLGAGQASAVTTVVTQTVYSSFFPHGSIGPVPIGGLNLFGDLKIVSATLNYSYSGGIGQSYFNLNNVTPVTYTYSGGAGFYIFSLPVQFSASSSASGSNLCTNNYCGAFISGSGTMDVPLADLAAFAGKSPLQFAAQGGFSGTIDQVNAVALMASDYGYTASGTITYVLSDGALPEPATWAMMILGVGLIGRVLRRRARVAVAHA